MNVKKSGIIATAAAGVVLVGGGAWAATAIASDEPAAQPEIVTTPGGEPNSVPVETATPEPSAEATPTSEAPASPVVEAGRESADSWGISITDAEILEVRDYICDGLANGSQPVDLVVNSGYPSSFVDDLYWALEEGAAC